MMLLFVVEKKDSGKFPFALMDKVQEHKMDDIIKISVIFIKVERS
jgi:hypothetical protein